MMTTTVPLDDLELFGLREDPILSEKLILSEHRRARHDPLTAKILESTYWEADRPQAFDRFRSSLEFAKIASLLETWKISKTQPLVEIGGGSGFLAWGLSQIGFQDVSLLEPNSGYTTGTGYLQTRQDAKKIEIENSLEAWYLSRSKYGTVVTRNVVHHFQNITMAAASIRQKMEAEGYWVMIREPYVESADEFYRFMHTHPFSQRYGIYEFAYPPSHFISAVEMAGFRLRAVVPAQYANNSLSLYATEEGGALVRGFTRFMDALLRYLPSATIAAYRIEKGLRSWLPLAPLFSRPQVMLFQRRELGQLAPSAIWYPPENPSPSPTLALAAGG